MIVQRTLPLVRGIDARRREFVDCSIAGSPQAILQDVAQAQVRGAMVLQLILEWDIFGNEVPQQSISALRILDHALR